MLINIPKMLKDNKKKTAKDVYKEILTHFHDWQAKNKKREAALAPDAQEGDD